MQYKTISLELLRQQTELHERLRIARQLLPTMERCAQQLKENHEAWKETLSQGVPADDQTLVNSQAMELAIKDLEDHLRALVPQDNGEPLSLDAIMAHLAGRTSST